MSSIDEPIVIRGKLIPTCILERILDYLPIPALAQTARVSKSLKALVYGNDIWNVKLNIMLENDTGALTAILETSLELKVDTRDRIYIDNRPLYKLIPGLSRVPFESSLSPMEQFKELYKQLIPCYIGLRDHDNKALLDYENQPEVYGQLVNLLVGLGRCHVSEDWKELNEAVDTLARNFQAFALDRFALAYDLKDIDSMRTFSNSLIMLNGGSVCTQMYIQKHSLFCSQPFSPQDNFEDSAEDTTPFENLMLLIKDDLKEQSHWISEIFPKKMDLFHIFVDRVFEDVVAEFIAHLLEKAMQINVKLYLKTMSVVLKSTHNVMKALTSDDGVPERMEKDRGLNLLFKLFLPFLDDYLYEERKYTENKTRAYIEEWNNRSTPFIDASLRLTNQSRETFKRNYLNAFKKVILLPVDLVSSAATTIVSPFQRSSSKRSSGSSSETKEATVQLESARQELDMLQDYLSLEISLQLVHINKESERRVEEFIMIGFPGRMKRDIQKTYEQIYIQLLKSLSTLHIQPGFESAISQLSSYKPNPYNPSEDVPPLTELFELVHVADVIQQMVQLYYDEEITKHVDKLDFLNNVNKEKKAFERLLDDCVAQGMDHGIQVLMSQVEFILTHEQTKQDYNPPSNGFPELRPTKACQDTIQFLKQNIALLRGASEKGTINLFFEEICRGFFEILCKHLKSQTVNEQGGIRYISDMNAYYAFVATVGQKECTACFLALKSLANIYIVESPSDLKSLLHDLERYHGLMRMEDLFEFASCRSDWSMIKRVVQKDMTDCSIM